jgi:hypothetical protein
MGFFGSLLKALPGVGMLAGIGQIGLGVGQMIKGRRMEYPELQGYDIPEEYLQNMSDAQIQSFIGLPEAQKREFVENVQRSGATALSAASTRKGGLGLIPKIAQQQKDAFKGLLSADAAARMENLNIFFQARTAMGEQKTMKQQREMDIVAEKRGLRQEMIGAGMQNIGAGFGTMAGAGITEGRYGFGNTSSTGRPLA